MKLFLWALLMLVLGGLWLMGCLSWGLRDGLGPDAVESTGIIAIYRFLDQFWETAVVGFGSLVVIAVCLKKCARKP